MKIRRPKAAGKRSPARPGEPRSERRAPGAVKRWSFELRIRPQGDTGFQVHLLSSPAGDEVADLELPFAPDRADCVMGDLETSVSGFGRNLAPVPPIGPATERPAADGRIEAIGGELFEALFPPAVRRRWDECLAGIAKRPDRGLRIVLKSNPACRETAELHRLPWELLRDPRSGGFLALSRKTTVIRQLDLGAAAVLDPPKPAEKLLVLAVLAHPPGVEPLDLARERRRIEEALEGRADIELRCLEDPTFAELTEALRSEPWHVLHFMGHGAFDRRTDQGYLFLTGADGALARLPAERLAQVVRDVESLRLVVLNACETGRPARRTERPFAGLAHALVRSGVPAVVAMQLPILDRAAIELSRVFYRRLADGEEVDEALAEARVAVYAAEGDGGSGAWAVPVLFVRNPDLVVFRPRRGGAEESAAARRARSRRRLTASLMVVLGALVVGLFFVRTPWSGIDLAVTASRVGFTLSEDQSLVDVLALSELAVPDVAWLRHPDPASGMPRVVTADDLGADRLGFVAATSTDSAEVLSLDDAPLPAGTRVDLEWVDAGLLRLSLDLGRELEDERRVVTAATGAGAILRLVPGRRESLSLGPPGRLVMAPRGEHIDLDLTLAGSGGEFHTPLVIEDLRFGELHEQVRTAKTRLWETSTLEAGSVTLEPLGGGEPVEIDVDRLDAISFGDLRGQVTGLVLSEKGLEIEFRGRVGAIASQEPDGRLVDLMPTWSRSPWVLRLGTSAGAFGVLLMLLVQSRDLLTGGRAARARHLLRSAFDWEESHNP